MLYKGCGHSVEMGAPGWVASAIIHKINCTNGAMEIVKRRLGILKELTVVFVPMGTYKADILRRAGKVLVGYSREYSEWSVC